MYPDLSIGAYPISGFFSRANCVVLRFSIYLSLLRLFFVRPVPNASVDARIKKTIINKLLLGDCIWLN